MAKPIDEFKDYWMGDVLGHIKGVTAKKLFGGYGLYLNENIFAIITSEVDVYFKVDNSNRERYEKELKSHQFIYDGHKKPCPMPYWHINEEVMEDRELVTDLVHESAEISKQQNKKKNKKR